MATIFDTVSIVGKIAVCTGVTKRSLTQGMMRSKHGLINLVIFLGDV